MMKVNFCSSHFQTGDDYSLHLIILPSIIMDDGMGYFTSLARLLPRFHGSVKNGLYLKGKDPIGRTNFSPNHDYEVH